MVTLDFTFAKIVSEKNEIELRNARARAYSREVELHRQRKANKVEEVKFYIGSFVGAAGIFVMLFFAHIVGVIIM